MTSVYVVFLSYVRGHQIFNNLLDHNQSPPAIVPNLCSPPCPISNNHDPAVSGKFAEWLRGCGGDWQTNEDEFENRVRFLGAVAAKSKTA
jgi:hypothetical protein